VMDRHVQVAARWPHQFLVISVTVLRIFSYKITHSFSFMKIQEMPRPAACLLATAASQHTRTQPYHI
jgi:hypothetical protein